jgi:hypothetical protein
MDAVDQLAGRELMAVSPENLMRDCRRGLRSMCVVAEATRRRRVIELSIRRRDRRRIIGEWVLHRYDGIFGTDRPGDGAPRPNILW